MCWPSETWLPEQLEHDEVHVVQTGLQQSWRRSLAHFTFGQRTLQTLTRSHLQQQSLPPALASLLVNTKIIDIATALSINFFNISELRY
jgi:hypothetical protein